MRVAIDATSLPKNRTGVGHYLLELIAALDCNLYILGKLEDLDELASRAPSAELIPCDLRNRATRLLWEQTVLPVRLRQIAPDLLHSPHYSIPFLSPVRTVTVMHDATFWLYPQAHQRHKQVWFRTVSSAAARIATRVITVSNASRKDLISVGVPEHKLDVVHHGVDASWFELATETEGDYICFVGTLEPRKNLPRLLRAYRRSGLALEFKIAGARGWRFDELEAEIAKTPRVSLLGYVSDAAKRELISKARVFVYPSIAEGFGIPVLEAMAAGVPVVTSNVSATAEVAGDAALTVNPLDEEALAEALVLAATDDATRKRLIHDGATRARSFTWQRTARETIDSWRKALS